MSKTLQDFKEEVATKAYGYSRFDAVSFGPGLTETMLNIVCEKYADQRVSEAHNKAIQQAIDKLRENSWFDIFGERANHEIVQKLESLKVSTT